MIAPMPVASPSRPSIRLSALVTPTIQTPDASQTNGSLKKNVVWVIGSVRWPIR